MPQYYGYTYISCLVVYNQMEHVNTYCGKCTEFNWEIKWYI